MSRLTPMQADPFRMDNVLLRAGLGLLLLWLVAVLAVQPWASSDASGAYLITLVDERGQKSEQRSYVPNKIVGETERIASLRQRYPDAVNIEAAPRRQKSGNAAYLLVAALAPAAMLAVGTLIRRRERRLVSIWNVLHQNVETDVRDLLDNSAFKRPDIEWAVGLLNRRGLAFYAWRRDTDTIEDGRLGSTMLHIDRCDSCGASVGLSIPASLREVPCCEYCGSAQSADQLNRMKREVITELRDRPVSTGSAAARAPRMSMGVFVVLVLLCWPAAIAYAIYKTQGSQRLS